ncbi:amidohydrolase [Wukongibacter baidiensis]|uniref:amidohydrolase n=1 Tax=Wukongibacter baidiensis TaxID=1723361 RepID=UPI003D7FAB37
MLLIKNGKLMPMNGEILEGASILVVDGKIKEIGSDISIPEGAKIIDAEGKIVMPGFIDAHTHLGLKEDSIQFEGMDHNEMTDPITPQMRGIDAINPMDVTFREAYEAGVTSVAAGPGSANVIGGQFAAIKTYGKRVDDMVIKEPIAMKCAFGENPKRVYNQKGKAPTTRMAIASLLRETLFKAQEYRKKLEASKDDPTKAPAFDMKMEAMQPVINREIPLKVHAHRADDILTAIRIAEEFDIKITLDHCTEGHFIKEFIKDRGLNAIVGPSFNHRSKFELKHKSFITPGILNKEGIKISITTDSPVVPLQYLTVCAALAVKEGLDKIEALKAITINAAEILGIDDRVGSLEVGKDADIVIWDDEPLNIFSSVIYTIIDGKIIYSSEDK